MFVSFLAAALGAPALPPAPPPTSPVKTAASTAAPLPSLFSTDDYPAEAVRKEEQGTVGATLTIDRDGHVTRCDVTQHATPSLDARTCQIILERARYTPARDEKGRPTEGSDTVRVRWALPADGPSSHLLPDSIDRILTLTTAGQPSSCEGRLMFGNAEVKEVAASVCESANALPPSLGADLAAMSNKPTPRVRISWYWLRDSTVPAPKLGSGAGERLLSSKALTLQFDASGKQNGCTTDASTGTLGASLLGDCGRPPIEVDPVFVPKDGRIRLISAIYLVGE